MQMMHEIIEFQVEQSSQISKHVSFDVWSETGRALLCVSLPHLGFIVFEKPFGARSAGVIRHVENHYALFLPANEGTIRHSLHHGQEVLVAMVTCGHHGEGGPVVLFQHLKYDLELQRGGAGELEVDGAAFLNMNTSHREQGMNSFDCTEVSRENDCLHTVRRDWPLCCSESWCFNSKPISVVAVWIMFPVPQSSQMRYEPKWTLFIFHRSFLSY